MKINQVELSKLNPDKAYIQITFAEPYFDNYGKCGKDWSRSEEEKLAIQNGKLKLFEYISEDMSHKPQAEDISVENKIERFIRPKGRLSFSVTSKLLMKL